MTQLNEEEKCVSEPHKFRWFLFGGLIALPGLGLLAVILIFMFKIPDKILQSKLDAQREAAHARGEATSLDDFQLKELPDSENAAVAYRNAYALFKMPIGSDFDGQNIWSRYVASKTYEIPKENSKKGEKDTPSGALSLEEENQVETFVISNENAYKAVCDASKLTSCQYGDYGDPSASFKVYSDGAFFSKMDSVRPLSKIIALRVTWETRHGNTDAAYEWIMRGFHLAESLQTDPALIAGLQCNAVIVTLFNSLNTIMCETPWTAKLPDGFEQKLELFRDRRVFARYFEGERYFMDAGLISKWNDSPKIFTLPIQRTLYKVNSDFIRAIQEPDPVKRKELLEIIDRYSSVDGQSSWFSPSDNKVKEESPQRTFMDSATLFIQYHKMMALVMSPGQFRAVDAFDRMEAQVLIVQQSLALKRYKQVHGQYPDQLQQLVPNELEMLPRDPFSGEPFHYKKEGNGFRLYSIGQDRVDNGGSLPLKLKGDVTWLVTQ